MPNPIPADAGPGPGRRAAILQAALGIFLRYGYKKASMDDLARAAGLSRQGLYLHFLTKEALFRDSVVHLVQQSRVALGVALAREDLGIADRVLGAFVALKSQGDGSAVPQEHMNELFATATMLAGPALAELDAVLVTDLARALDAAGVPAQWKRLGLSAEDLARHLQAASFGIKHQATSAADYQERMRVAVQLVCASTAQPSGA